MRTIKTGIMLGLSNRREAPRLRTKIDGRIDATYLHEAQNVDLTDDGYLRRRHGFQLALASGLAHSLFEDGAGGAFCAFDSDLVHLDERLNRTTLRGGLPAQPKLSYTRAPDGDIYWSNGLEIGRIHAGEARPIITPTPTPPTVSATSGGLPAGRYQVAFTATGPDGESAATFPIALELPKDSGIAIGSLPAGVRVYMTGPDGEVFTRVPGASGVVATLANTGERLQTLLMAEMPPGQIVRHYAGRLLSAAGAVLWLSEPYQYGLMNPARNWLPFPAPITVVEPCEDGVFVCADATYWLPGDLLDTSPVKVLPYGGLDGSGGVSPDQRTVFWGSDQGIVIGAPGGQVTTPQSGEISFGHAPAGATAWREQDGQTHLIAVRTDAAPATNVARSFTAAENRRKENA